MSDLDLSTIRPSPNVHLALKWDWTRPGRIGMQGGMEPLATAPAFFQPERTGLKSSGIGIGPFETAAVLLTRASVAGRDGNGAR